ncbi:HP1 family phage holin [Vibrio algicola]|uniref:Holin n=1 Tax=Vibrio algicola TaxID=2662262 RepID=A0A5Q0TMB1_9VIBR|nr:HP1 family phage holin [Vibrio algicola]
MKTSIMDKTVTTSSYVASVSTAIGGLFTLSDVALLIGIVTTLILFVMQHKLYKKRSEQDKIKAEQDAEFHAARMKAIKGSLDSRLDELKQVIK